MKKVTIDSVTYNSLAEAWRELKHFSVSFALARKRVSRGWIPKMAISWPVVAPVDRRSSKVFDALSEIPLKKTGFEI